MGEVTVVQHLQATLHAAHYMPHYSLHTTCDATQYTLKAILHTTQYILQTTCDTTHYTVHTEAEAYRHFPRPERHVGAELHLVGEGELVKIQYIVYSTHLVGEGELVLELSHMHSHHPVPGGQSPRKLSISPPPSTPPP